jgi:4-amino-4-deoxy-L-arabinose transferase-like glycosyltransferase
MDESLNQEREMAYATPLVFEPRRALAAARRWAVARAAGLLCAALLAVMSLQMLAVISRKGITVDEIVLIPAAYYHLVTGDFQLISEHPPLVKFLAALPLLFIQPDEAKPDQMGAQPYSPMGKWLHMERFWEGNPDAFETISFWTRVPMIALTLALGVALFAFARELFGPRAAVLAVALFSLEPTVLAHGRVVQTDIAAAFGYLLLFFTLYRYALAPSGRRALWLGVAAGLALLAKFSMLVAGPVLLVFFLARLRRAPRPPHDSRKTSAAHAAVVALVALFVVNAAYYFHSRPLVEEDVQWAREFFPASHEAVLRAVGVLSYIVPTDYALGVFWQLWHNQEGHPAGLLGMFSRTGWWYYFPVAFALKTTLPFLLLSLASLAWGAYRYLKDREARFLFLLAPFAVYTAGAMMGRLNIGVRYYLPAYMFLFILGGALLDRLLRARRAGRAGALAAVALLCWTGVEAVRAFPDQMTYMNQLASRAPHWWYLSDSNVEWGDDAGALARYLRERGETRVRAAFLGGFITLHHYGVGYVDMIPSGHAEVPRTRYAAVGASFLNGSTVPQRQIQGRWLSDEERINTFDEYRRRTPEAVFGGSIYLYREDGQ